MNRPLAELEDVIGYSFTNKQLLENALTHSSYLNENRQKSLQDNERLEFFGDAIIEFYVSEFLFNHFSDFPEGDLTKTRAALVCENALAACAREIDLGDYILMGKGEEQTGGRSRASITSDAFEALVAAIHIDSDGVAVLPFIRKHLLDPLKDKQFFYDAKTRLQELVQQVSTNELHYELVEETGPIHNRTFVAAAILNGQEIGRGSGHSKKDAQQHAAMDAISKFRQ